MEHVQINREDLLAALPDMTSDFTLPGLEPLMTPPRVKDVPGANMGWYHCFAADICGDEREEVVVYNPWDKFVAIYTPAPLDEDAYAGYRATPRQYNARLMD